MHSLHRSLLERFNRWVGSHRNAAILLGVAGLLLATAMVSFVVLYQSPREASAPNAQPTPSPTPEAPKFYSPLTGVEVPDKATTKLPVTGIMIENSQSARPQSGLKTAGIVYEAVAEGGITRFLALYQEAKPQLIGPVRSVRLYYVDWLAPYHASIAHVGGSLFALREVRNGNYRDLDQFFNGQYYWRATDRYAPHNVYTSFKKLDELNKRRGYTSSTFKSWPRADGKPADKKTAVKIDVTISGPLYNSHYNYDAAKNTYTRYQGGAVHKDREAGAVKPSVVIVMNVNMHTVFEDGYREQITTTGSGTARIFQNGTVTKAKWTKKDRGSQLQFLDSKGKPITLNRGQTWITAVPANQGGGVTWQ